MLIFFCGTIISAENGKKPNPPIVIVPLATFEKKPGPHPLSKVQYRIEVIRDIQEEDVETDIEGETRIEEDKRESWLKWCCRCISGRDDND